MTRFYFHLTSKQDNIPDDSGKELDTLIDAYDHARVLIDKILFHVGYDDADLWKVVISNRRRCSDDRSIRCFSCCSQQTPRDNLRPLRLFNSTARTS